ncbi:universal stress protein [Streptomyces sp. TRM64462]|uniref:universal stress protein n=1 Tax=Streptomyces sp. TRM64462 TaxID=2741726 RepID=UPI001586B7DA|nr:universal stress protein [Streptomyces sp. TRM64462]
MGGAVVVGVDGSPTSLAAVDVAAREARMRSVGLRLVHAFVWPAMHVPAGPSLLGPAHGALREDTERMMREAVERAGAHAPDVHVDQAVIAGEPLSALEAQSRDAALLVVGSRGQGRFAGVLVGSVAVHLAGHSRCPVLVVRGRPDPVGPVLVAVDGSAEGRAAAEFASLEAAMRGAELAAVHVSADAHSGAPRAEGERILADALSGIDRPGVEVAASARLVTGPVRQALIEESEGAQLLVVGARGLGGFAGLILGSVSQAVLHHAHCPVAVVRHRGNEE